MKKIINENETNKNSNINNNSLSLLKCNITEHYKIESKNNIFESKNNNHNNIKKEIQKIYFINDYYVNEEKKDSAKIINGKEVININDIVGEEASKPITFQMIDTSIDNFSLSKISTKSFGVIKSYAVNTNQGIVRDYNEDRVSIVINMNKPDYYESSIPWQKISYFGVFDGHAGNKCADFLRDNLLEYIIRNKYFPSDIPNAIKLGFKNIDEDYLKNFAFIDGKLIDNSGSCGLILLIVKNIIYIANVGDSRCIGSFQNGNIQKDITTDHKPNFPEEKNRIMKNGGSIYQTQTPLDDELYKDKILVGPYRVLPGKLSVSRTVGDAEGKIEQIGGNKNVLISLPDIYEFNLDNDDIDFFILGCDGIYDQLTSKEVLDCAWNIINNNIKMLKNNQNNNNFKGNYGNEININTTSGNIIDLILKASMLRKSFDNVTCLFISFKDYFENIKINEHNQNNNNNYTIHKHKKMGLKDLLFRNNSNIESSENNNKNEINNNLHKDKKEIKKILSEPQFFENNKNKNNEEELINNIRLTKKMSKNNSKNKEKENVIKNNEKNESFNTERSNSFNKNNLTTTKNYQFKNTFNKNISSINFFTKNNFMGFNIKNKNKSKNKLMINNKIIYNLNNKDDNYRHNSYNKKIKQLHIENSNNFGIKIKNKNFLYPKINNNILLDYNNKNIKNDKNNTSNNISNNINDIRSNSFNNIKDSNKKYRVELTKEKNFYHNNLKIKFSNIIKKNLNGKNKSNITENDLIINNNADKYLKNNNEIKFKKKIPSLTDNLYVYNNNKLNIRMNGDKNQRHKRFLSKNKLKRKINLSEKKKLFYGDFKAQINFSNKNIFEFKYNTKNNNIVHYDIRKNESNSFKSEEKSKI